MKKNKYKFDKYSSKYDEEKSFKRKKFINLLIDKIIINHILFYSLS